MFAALARAACENAHCRRGGGSRRNTRCRRAPLARPRRERLRCALHSTSERDAALPSFMGARVKLLERLGDSATRAHGSMLSWRLGTSPASVWPNHSDGV